MIEEEKDRADRRVEDESAAVETVADAESAATEDEPAHPEAEPRQEPQARPEPVAPTPAQAPTAPAPAAPAQSGSANSIAWLALLLALVTALGTVWGLIDSQRRESDTLQRLQGLEVVSGRDASTLDQITKALERQVELEVKSAQTDLRGEIQTSANALRDQLAQATEDARSARGGQADTQRSFTELRDSLNASIKQLEAQLDRQRGQLNDYQQVSSGDRDSWLLAEANYLLRLSNQRLIMTSDTASAEALLRSADGILRELDDPSLHSVREALAADLAAVRAVPSLDRQGIYLRVAALVDQIDELKVFATPSLELGDAPASADAEWQTRLRAGYERALAKLSDYVVVRRRDEPVEVLMDPQWESLVRQNLRMLLEQAQVSLLSGNEKLYRESLTRTAEWVKEFEASDAEGVAAMTRELNALQEEQIAVDMPDATRTLAAMQAVLDARAARNRGDS